MSNYLRTRLHFLIALAGCLMSFFGIFILASGIMIRNIMGKEDIKNYQDQYPLTCQYWAGIPTILTGIVLVLAVFLNKNQIWKYISFCCVLVTTVLTLGVIIEESSNASGVHNAVHDRDSFCDRLSEGIYTKGRDQLCNKLKKADPWYYILLFVTDIAFVVCSFVVLVLFADWILFVAPELSHREQMLSVTSGQTSHHFDESRARLRPPQVQQQVLPAPHPSYECPERSLPTQGQEQVWLPLQTR